ncbi:hypothetical protein ACWE42_19280 [Sutcliffiella cohnii]
MEKIQDLQQEIFNTENNYSLIARDEKHPVSILLDRINMNANGFEHGSITTQQMENIQRNLIKKYEANKPEVLMDIEEVYHFVNIRMRELINKGCTEEEVKKFYKEYIELQKKYLEKGYEFKI